jgi:hypothetical protein
MANILEDAKIRKRFPNNHFIVAVTQIDFLIDRARRG